MNLETNSGWVEGDLLPQGVNYHGLIAYQNGVVSSGGKNADGDLIGEMFKLTCTNTISDCKWEVMKQKLQNPRWGHFSMLIPDSLANELCL